MQYFCCTSEIVHMQDIKSVIEGLRQTCLVLGVREAARVVTNFTNDQLRPVDLNVAQLGLMSVYSMHPDKNMSAIAEILMLDESTLTRNLLVLERRGLVQSVGGRGRGGKQVMLTPEGMALLESGLKIWGDVNHKLAARLSKRDVEAGRQFLGALIDAADRTETAKPATRTRKVAAERVAPAKRPSTLKSRLRSR